MTIITTQKLNEKREKFKGMIEENFRSLPSIVKDSIVVTTIKRIALHIAMQCYLEGIGDVYAEQLRLAKEKEEVKK